MSNKAWRILAAAMIFFALGTYGCIFDSTENAKPADEDEIEWPDLTEKEDCIETILILYNNFNKLGNITDTDVVNTRYANVLYDDSKGTGDYVWHMSQVDINAEYPEILTRQEDIEGTIYLLSNASAMTMEIPAALWTSTKGEVCDNCWATTRYYTFYCTINHKGELKQFHGDTVEIEFVVGPHHNDPNKWAIYKASDKKTL